MSRPVRFTFILFLAALGTTLAAVGGWRYARASAPVSGPIIVISIDTLRADHLPAYGYTKVKTPAIDALAADGVVFERAYSHAPQTLPAHASLLSGRLPFETGVRDNVGFAVKAGERLLPQMLRDRGFTTGGVVSAYVLRKETGIGQGFDFFDGEMPPSSPRAVDRPGAARRRRVGGDRRALARIDRHRRARSSSCTSTSRTSRTRRRRASREYAPYDGEIAYADEIVGRLVRYLKSHQLYDRSTIILLSDHGEGLGDHGEQEHGLFVYDEAIHVPLIIKQESNAGAGRRVADLVQHVDLVPTILDLVKAPVPGGLRGRSLKPLLEGTGRLPRHVGVLGGALRALSLRLERADGAHRRPLPLHQGAARGALRSASAMPTSAPTSPASGRRRAQALRGALDRDRRRRDDSGARRGLGRGARAAAGARLRRRADRRADRAPARRCRIPRTNARSSSATAPRSISPASGNGRRRSRCCSRSSATIRRWPTSGASSRCSRRASIATTWRSTPTSTSSS